MSGDFDAARAIAEEAVAKARQVQDRAGEASALFQVGAALGWARNREQAAPYFRESAIIGHALRRFKAEAESWQAYGEAMTVQGRSEPALDAYKSMFEAAREAGLREVQALALCRAGDAEARRGRPEEARMFLERSLVISDRIGAIDVGTTARLILSKLALESQDIKTATLTANKAFEMAMNANAERPLARAAAQVAAVALAAGDPHLALEFLELPIIEKLREVGEWAVADMLSDAGIALLEVGDHSGSRRALEKAFQIFEEQGDMQGMADSMFGLGRVAEARGDDKDALKSYEAAAAFGRALGDEDTTRIAEAAAEEMRRSAGRR